MQTHDTPTLKKTLRAEALARRRAIADGIGAAASESIRAVFMREMPPGPETVVAGYWPIGGEVDVRPLLEAAQAAGARVALPAVVERHAALEFRLWQPGEALESGAHGTAHPAAMAPVVTPDVVLVPLLAFDDAGWRLGYGGGYYDRTLAALRAEQSVLAVGVGFAAQRLDKVPHDATDQRLDRILTEVGLVDCA
jgi:5-formyltetrahydrofolate cyclo-ligase